MRGGYDMSIMQVILSLTLIGVILIVSCSIGEKEDIESTIITIEKAALDRWGKGDPWGYTEICADEVTYFDTSTERRIDGLESLKKYYAPLEGKIHIERYDMIDPKVQIHGNTAVLTFNLIDYIRTPDGSIEQDYWSSTEVYCRINNAWKIIHTHWSKPKINDEIPDPS
jgi:hypothetical protein